MIAIAVGVRGVIESSVSQCAARLSGNFEDVRAKSQDFLPEEETRTLMSRTELFSLPEHTSPHLSSLAIDLFSRR